MNIFRNKITKVPAKGDIIPPILDTTEHIPNERFLFKRSKVEKINKFTVHIHVVY